MVPESQLSTLQVLFHTQTLNMKYLTTCSQIKGALDVLQIGNKAKHHGGSG